MISFPHNIFELGQMFSCAEACQDFLFQIRWPNGFKCAQCGGGCRVKLRFMCGSSHVGRQPGAAFQRQPRDVLSVTAATHLSSVGVAMCGTTFSGLTTRSKRCTPSPLVVRRGYW